MYAITFVWLASFLDKWAAVNWDKSFLDKVCMV
jgi:hypothetical protein